MINFRTKTKRSLTKVIEKALEQIAGNRMHIDISLTQPPNNTLGDYAFACFQCARMLGKNPSEFSKILAQKIQSMNLETIEIEKAEPTGPYLNFFFKKGYLAKKIFKGIFSQSGLYGSSLTGGGKKALIEHTSINPNAPPHLGRARNAWIGDCLARLLKFEGYMLETRFFVNDVGKQIALLTLGVGNSNPTFREMLDIYIKINNRLKNEPMLEIEVRELLQKLENGNEQVRKNFRRVVMISINGMREIFANAGINYDQFDFESDYLTKKKHVEILKKFQDIGKLFEDEDKRLVLNLRGFDLPSKNPVIVITRSDKTSLYPLRDIAYSLDKIKTSPSCNLVVLGEDQKLYHQQITAALSLLGSEAPKAVHYSYVLLGGGSMSTRQGNLVLLEDFLAEATEKAKQELIKRDSKIDDSITLSIAYSALKFSFLRVANDKQVVFDWDTAMNFEGDTGPYILYCHARICSVLRKYGDVLPIINDFSVFDKPEESDLIKVLGEFPEYISRTLSTKSPHVLANYLLHLAHCFSSFYHACPILKAEKTILEARIVLAEATKRILAQGLNLLGISPLERM